MSDLKNAMFAVVHQNSVYQQLDAELVEMFDEPERGLDWRSNEDPLPSCYICLDISDNDESPGPLRRGVYLGHKQCGRRAHAECILTWFKSNCRCPICRRCVKEHKVEQICQRLPVEIQSWVIDEAEFRRRYRVDWSLWSPLSERIAQLTFSTGIASWPERIWLARRIVVNSIAFEAEGCPHIDEEAAHGIVQDFCKHYHHHPAQHWKSDEISRLDFQVRRARQDWLASWNEYVNHIIRDAENMPRSFVPSLPTIRIFCETIKVHFFTLRERERTADFYYKWTLQQLNAYRKKVDSGRVSAVTIARLPEIFPHAVPGLRIYYMTSEEQQEAYRQLNWLARKARYIWVAQRKDACDEWYQHQHRMKRLIQHFNRVWRGASDSLDLLPAVLPQPMNWSWAWT